MGLSAAVIAGLFTISGAYVASQADDPSMTPEERALRQQATGLSALQGEIAKDSWEYYKANLRHYEQKMIKNQYLIQKFGMDLAPIFSQEYPEKVPGLAEAEEAINTGYGSSLANIRRDVSQKRPYEPTTSALGQSLEQAARFKRTGDLARTRGEKQYLWSIEREDKRRKNITDWLNTMHGVPIASTGDNFVNQAGSAAGTAAGLAGQLGADRRNQGPSSSDVWGNAFSQLGTIDWSNPFTSSSANASARGDGR